MPSHYRTCGAKSNAKERRVCRLDTQAARGIQTKTRHNRLPRRVYRTSAGTRKKRKRIARGVEPRSINQDTPYCDEEPSFPAQVTSYWTCPVLVNTPSFRLSGRYIFGAHASPAPLLIWNVKLLRCPRITSRQIHIGCLYSHHTYEVKTHCPVAGIEYLQ